MAKAEKADSADMEAARLLSVTRFRTAATAALLAWIAMAACAATTTRAADSADRPSFEPAASPYFPLLHSFLTWPKEEASAKDEGQEDKDASKDDAEEEEPLESDRPDFTESTSTVGFRRLQIESGYTFTHGVGGDSAHNVHDLPELLVRYGVAERLELRLAWDEGVLFERFRDEASGRIVRQTDYTDMEIGFKYAIGKQDAWKPKTAIIVAISAPVGSPAESSRQVDTRVNFCYSWDITKKLSLNCSTGNVWTAQFGDRYTQFFQTGSLDYELTKKLHVFSEAYGLFDRNASDNRPQYFYNAGVTYLVTPNFQLDWRAGCGLNAWSDAFFTGCGLTIRK
jgi:hypothetical protein